MLITINGGTDMDAFRESIFLRKYAGSPFLKLRAERSPEQVRACLEKYAAEQGVK